MEARHVYHILARDIPSRDTTIGVELDHQAKVVLGFSTVTFCAKSIFDTSRNVQRRKLKLAVIASLCPKGYISF